MRPWTSPVLSVALHNECTRGSNKVTRGGSWKMERKGGGGVSVRLKILKWLFVGQLPFLNEAPVVVRLSVCLQLDGGGRQPAYRIQHLHHQRARFVVLGGGEPHQGCNDKLCTRYHRLSYCNCAIIYKPPSAFRLRCFGSPCWSWVRFSAALTTNIFGSTQLNCSNYAICWTAGFGKHEHCSCRNTTFFGAIMEVNGGGFYLSCFSVLSAYLWNVFSEQTNKQAVQICIQQILDIHENKQTLCKAQ